MSKPKVLFIVGPTASGKTALSIELAKRLNGEIVSADSMQIYKGMDIGTAKPSRAEMQGIPHHMIDIIGPNEDFSVAEYQKRAKVAIYSILEGGKQPIVVGGTGLYVDCLIKPLDFTGTTADPAIRQKWEKYLAENGAEALHKKLEAVDSETAQRLHPNNTRRVIRALEVYEDTGRPMSSQVRSFDQVAQQGEFDAVLYGLCMPRDVLYARIERRVDQMMEAGLLGEIKGLLQDGVNPDVQSMKAIGYKELVSVLQGKDTLEHAVGILKQNSRRYAKRQMTWFRTNKSISWLEMSTNNTNEKLSTEITRNFLGNS